MKKSVRYFNPSTTSKTKPPVLIACLLIAIVGTVLTFYSRAEIFCDINPANNNQAISAALASCADGTTIRFPANASYSLPDTIFVKDRNNLVIDGRGSSFTLTTQGNTKPPSQTPGNNKTGGNWLLLRGYNITLKNMTAIGSFPLAGQPRDLGKASAEPGYAEWMPNYGVNGTDGAYLQDLTGRAPWGDTVTTGPDNYVDNNANPKYSSNVFIKRVHAETTSRMCFALTSGNNMWLEDSTCKDAWYGGTDEELDSVNQPMAGLHILRNRFEGFNLFGVYIPVAGSNSRDIEIRDNIFSTPPDADKPCNNSIGIGAYPDSNPAVFTNVAVENNTIVAHNGATAINLDHIQNGTLKNNKITSIAGGCSSGPATTKVTNSTGMVIENNGPDAPGAGGMTTPPPPTQTDSPPTVSLLSPVTGAQVSGIVAVTANASDNNGVGRVDFLVDGTVVATDTTSPYAFNWDTTNLSGSHNLSAKATDTASQSTTSSAVAVTIVTQPPVTGCAPPTNFAGSPGSSGSGQYNFTWQPVTGATQYDIYYESHRPPSTPAASPLLRRQSILWRLIHHTILRCEQYVAQPNQSIRTRSL